MGWQWASSCQGGFWGDEGASLSLQVICAPAQWSGSGVLGTVQQFGSLCAHLFVHSANI